MTNAGSAQEIPPKVTDLAARRGLGTPIDQRSSGNPFKGAIITLVAGVVCLVVACGVLPPLAEVWRPLGWLAVVPFAFGVCLLGWAVVVLVRGFQAIYVYQGGVVHVRNGNARAATWGEVSEVEVQVIREGNLMAGKTSAYLVKPVNQSPMRVQSIGAGLPEGEQDQIGALLMRLATEAGRPVNTKLVGKK